MGESLHGPVWHSVVWLLHSKCCHPHDRRRSALSSSNGRTNHPDRVKVNRSLADAGGDTSPGCRKLQEGIVVTTVLICDDRRSVREGLTRVMSAVPGVHRIDCVAHGDELLARFSRQPVDVVLVGTQFAREFCHGR